jgi:hypothetical protein
MAETINITSKSGFYNNPDTKIFDNIYLIIFMIVIAFIFIGYAIYSYIQTSKNDVILNNSSYYGSDVSNYQPIFQETSKTINDCVNICKTDITCDGITYNLDTQKCLGTKNGQVRNENSSYSAWVKPLSDKTNTQLLTKDFTKSILVGYTKTMTLIDSNKIQNPYQLGNFCYSFNLTIYDFFKNYGSWRHIFHKGSPITAGQSLNYQSWENLLVDFPSQSIGVWIAPFTNNLRVAVTTTSLANTSYGSYSDAFVQKCEQLTENCYITDMPSGKWADTSRSGDGSIPKQILSTYVEFFDHDLQNIPINTQINITLNFRGKNVETLFDGKIVKVSSLDGMPDSNNSSLYVMNDKTVGGEITNLLYYPDALLLGDIQSIIELKTKV